MAFSGFQVNSIQVRNKSGGIIGTLQGKVKLQGGSGCGVSANGQVITLSVGREYTNPDDCYLQKLRAAIEGGTGDDCNGGTYTFTGMPYYVTSVNGEGAGEANNFDLYGSACAQVGIWNGSSILAGGALPIIDICPACIDCGDYEDIKTLLDRIKEFQEWDVSRNLHDPTPPNIGELALFRQYQATVHYWNYLVHEKTIPLELVRLGDRSFVIRSGYYNNDCTAHSVVQTLDVDFVKTGGGAGSPTDMGFDFSNVKTHQGSELGPPALGTVENTPTSHTLTVTYPSLNYRQFYMWEIVVSVKDPDTAVKLVSVDVESTWAGTHIVPTPVRLKELTI